jgi:hypothetical protein
VLGRLFDTVGRKPMIAGCYILSGLLLAITAYLFKHGVWTAQTQTAAWCVIFFFASAGASAAYLTVSEIFPMETRALAIAFFYAVGTAIGGITGPLLFGKLVATKDVDQVFWGYILGAALMIGAGIVQAIIGIEAARTNLEDVAKPLSAEAAEGAEGRAAPRGRGAHPRPAATGGAASEPCARAGALRAQRGGPVVVADPAELVAVGARRGHRRRGGRPRRRAARGRLGRARAARAGRPCQLPPLGSRPLSPRPRHRPDPRRHSPNRTIALRRRLSLARDGLPPNGSAVISTSSQSDRRTRRSWSSEMYLDDPRRLLGWANAARVERAGASPEFVTATCVTYLPSRWLLHAARIA